MKTHTQNSAPVLDRAGRLAALGRVPREVSVLLAESKTPLKAYELLWRLQARRGRSAPPSTIYRAVAALIEAGLAHRIESPGAYVVCSAPGGPHDPIFLICEQCGVAAESNPAGAQQKMRDHVERTGFHVHRLNFIVHGVCASCQQP